MEPITDSSESVHVEISEQLEAKVVKDGETLFLWEKGTGDYYSKDPDPELTYTFRAWMYRREGDSEDRLAAYEDYEAGTAEVFSETDLSLIEAAMDAAIAAAEADNENNEDTED